jgi:quercetin dioxygenase-like cupin family protein
MRMRRLAIEPRGTAPTYYHDDRPSIVYVIQGLVVEHNSFCTEEVVHRAGNWTVEFWSFVGHWRENRTKEVMVVLSVNVIPPEYRDMVTMDM